MCSRPVGRIPLKTRLFFPSVPVPNRVSSVSRQAGLKPGLYNFGVAFRPSLSWSQSYVKEKTKNKDNAETPRPDRGRRRTRRQRREEERRNKTSLPQPSVCLALPAAPAQ